MWTQNRPTSRPQRTPSVHSIASVSSGGRPPSMSNRSDVDDIPLSRSNSNSVPAIWQSQRQQSPHSFAKRISEPEMKVHQVKAFPPSLAKIPPRIREWNDPDDDDESYQSPTLDGNEDLMESPEKNKPMAPTVTRIGREEPRSPLPAPHIPGPLESQLAALMSKLIFLERKNPAISVKPDEFREMQARLKTLEAEKKTWQKRHEAIWALRDEDVENNIKIRVSKSHRCNIL